MNYFEKHIGDYLKDTAHLSLLEHGVYNRLFDVYYTREGGIPDNDAARLIGARTKEEKKALQSILCEFFCLREGHYIQERCDREITRYQDKQAKAKRSAEARWNRMPDECERNANAEYNGDATDMRTHSEGNAPRARPQTPDTRHQTPVTKDQDQPTLALVQTIAPCPHQEIIDLYHEVLPTGTKVKIWSDSRKRTLQARWRESEKHQSIEFWRKLFRYIAMSPFLTSRISPRDGHKQFVIALDWIVNPTNFVKIVEGKYHEAAQA